MTELLWWLTEVRRVSAWTLGMGTASVTTDALRQDDKHKIDDDNRKKISKHDVVVLLLDDSVGDGMADWSPPAWWVSDGGQVAVYDWLEWEVWEAR